MKKLVCELCGSNNFTKDDDFFTCDYCRTKYTPAQAQKIMIEGAVTVNRSGEVVNLGMLANLALESRDYRLALDYANRILEIDGESALGWFYRTSAIGHFSTVDHFRLEEMIKGFESALGFASEESRAELQERCAVALNEVGQLLMEQTLRQGLMSAVDPWRWEAHYKRCLTLIRAFHMAKTWKPGQVPLRNILRIADTLIVGFRYPSGGTTITGSLKMGTRKLNPASEQEMRVYVEAIRREIQDL